MPYRSGWPRGLTDERKVERPTPPVAGPNARSTEQREIDRRRLVSEREFEAGRSSAAAASPSSRPLEELAAAWLAAEREAIATGNARNAEQVARDLSGTYDGALRQASPEELLLAWESARKLQAAEELGSLRWLEARSVSELLRREYQASRTEPTEPTELKPD